MINHPHRNRGLCWIAACALVVATGCAAQRTGLPALASPATEKHRVGEFVWFDLLVDDPVRVKQFYGSLFGWTFEPLDTGGYDTVIHRGRPIGGIIQHMPEEDKSPDDIWLPSISVADVDAAAKQARAGGGEVLREPRRLGERGRVAVLRDPEGATFVVMRSPSGDPHDTARGTGDFLWVQLWTRDHEIPVQFYDDVAGWEMGEVLHHGEIEEGFFQASGTEVASVIELPWPDVKPNWLPYVGVDDVSATIAHAKQLGGRLLVQGKHHAILADSTGAAIGIGPLSTVEGSDR